MSLEERIWCFLVDDVALDVCLEVEPLQLHTSACGFHRELAVDGMTLEELHDVEPIERPVDRSVVEQESVFVVCLYCKRQVHASRYTNHLEKCMTGSRREVTPKQQQEAASETERQQLQTLSKPPLMGASDS